MEHVLTEIKSLTVCQGDGFSPSLTKKGVQSICCILIEKYCVTILNDSNSILHDKLVVEKTFYAFILFRGSMYISLNRGGKEETKTSI